LARSDCFIIREPGAPSLDAGASVTILPMPKGLAEF
jgi:molybdopterin biosynthesis enzyme